MNTICKTCRFWQRGFDPDQGNCHRHAPAAIGFALCTVGDKGQLSTTVLRVAPMANALVAWPTTGSGDWCGEWASGDAP